MKHLQDKGKSVKSKTQIFVFVSFLPSFSFETWQSELYPVKVFPGKEEKLAVQMFYNLSYAFQRWAGF